MRKPHWLLILLLSAIPCVAQMNVTEYRGFLRQLDTSAASWEGRITSLDIQDLNVTFSVGKAIELQKEGALKHLKFVRRVIAQQLTQERLSSDVSMLMSLEDVNALVSGIHSLLPNTEQAARWGQAIPSLTEEIGNSQLPLEKHTLQYADQLQDKAARCSK